MICMKHLKLHVILQCRKIVRGIINDARKLRAIAEERDLKEEEKEKGSDEEEDEEKKEAKKKAKKKKNKKKKKYRKKIILL